MRNAICHLLSPVCLCLSSFSATADDATADLRTLGAQLATNSAGDIVSVDLSRVNDDLFELLDGLPKLEHLAFGGNKMSGSALALLKTCPSLEELSVSGQQRTDSGLWSVAVTDFNVPHIATISSLQVLDL